MLIRDFIKRTTCPVCNSNLKVVLNHNSCTHTLSNNILDIKYPIQSSKKSFKRDLIISISFDLNDDSFYFSYFKEGNYQNNISLVSWVKIKNIMFNKMHYLFNACPNLCYYSKSSAFKFQDNLDIDLCFERMALKKDHIKLSGATNKYFINNFIENTSTLNNKEIPLIPITSYEDTINRATKLMCFS